MATELQHSETMSAAPSSSEAARGDPNADAALILAALGRMQAAAREEHAALAQLRASLLDMVRAIGNAKSVADSEAATAMLDEFEHRVDAMIEIAGGRAPDAPMQAPEADQVPTVSGVVSQLGPHDAPAETAVAEPEPVARLSGGPTVAMLTAMVEALSASIQPPAQAEEAKAVEETQQVADEPVMPVTLAEPPSPPANPAIETALLANIEQMQVRPFPPPDEGTAVIFTRAEPQPQLEPRPEVPPESAAAPEPAAIAEPEQTAPQIEATSAAAPEPAAIASEAEALAPQLISATLPPEAEFDPTDFLFGPEPEPDPAAFLLDPALPRKVVLPQAEFVATPPPPEPAQDNAVDELPAQDAPAAEADRPAPAEPAPEDPFRALKAMSENERIAIFS